LAGTFIYGLFFRYPYLLFVKGEKAYRYICKIAKNWGKNLIWASGSKVKVIYKNDSESEIRKVKETGEAVILISNHQSNVDIPALLGYLPLDFSFIAKKEMKKWPLIGRWMRRFDCIFLDRKNPRQGMKDMKEAIEKIKKGHSYVITDTKARIFPIALVGTYEIQSKKSLKVTSNKNVKIVVDNPINLDDLSREDQKRIHEIVNEIVRNNFEEYNNKN